jgi:hypothetical protein
MAKSIDQQIKETAGVLGLTAHYPLPCSESFMRRFGAAVGCFHDNALRLGFLKYSALARV